MKNENFKKINFMFCVALLILMQSVKTKAQNLNPPVQLQPPDGALGLPAPINGSWIMTWSSVPGAAYRLMTLIYNCESDDYGTLVITNGSSANLKHSKRNEQPTELIFNLYSQRQSIAIYK